MVDKLLREANGQDGSRHPAHGGNGTGKKLNE
jgi:hypothetical protein